MAKVKERYIFHKAVWGFFLTAFALWVLWQIIFVPVARGANIAEGGATAKYLRISK